MQCPRCNKANPEGAKFCLKCGARLGIACPQCATELPPDPDTRFCLKCGTELGAREPAAAVAALDTITERIRRLVPKEFAERLAATRGKVWGERRVVTILFSDVKGSTQMAENLDPEDVMEIMNGAFDVLIEPIYRYEGTLARLMGDAILAFFGAPIAHEDDPERACRAALEIIEGAGEYAKRLEEERGIVGFDVRVGINTGLVVVGEVGSDLRVEYTAMGDAINLASRMESAAEPGTVLITEETHKLITPLFETEALAPIQIKGKAEPVSVYRVLAPREAPRKVRGIAGLESPLVGREAELGALREAVERLQVGVGGVVTIAGEAGLGKSRLVAELRKDPSSASLQWVDGHCLSYGSSIAYLLWLDVLRGLLGVVVGSSPEAVHDTLRERLQAVCAEHFEDVYPYLARLLSLPLQAEYEAAVRDLDGKELKASTFSAVETLIRRAATAHPLVLACEDLHWADPTSVQLLEHLLPLTDCSSLLLICVFRPELEHGCWRIKEIATRRYPHRHTDLRLQPLPMHETETLVLNFLGAQGAPRKLRERILDHAEGNPFYVEEIMRSLVDQGVIAQDEASGRWQLMEEVADIVLPETLQGVLMARIDRLQADTKRVLQLASVIGRIFLHRILAAIAEEERELDVHLLSLQREQMIRERARIPELEYIFKHELTREAAYNGLLMKERRSFHRQVAEALERLSRERVEEQLGLLAHHWERAEDPDKAIHYLLRAGDHARTAFAHREAIDYYERALVFLKKHDQHERAARTLMKLGLTHHTAFDFRQARQSYEEGFALWQRAGETPSAALPPAPHALRAHWHNPRTLNPAMAEDVVSAGVIDQLFSGLVQLSPELAVVPDVAQTWEVAEGGRRYIFHLRHDVRWSDGSPVVAEDFEYAWKRVLSPATAAPSASLLHDIRGARAFHRGDVSDPDTVGVLALDQDTLAVELEEPTAYFLHLLAYSSCFPVPRHVVRAHGEAWTAMGNLVTNGPFQLKVWEIGESMVLVRNPQYHGRFGGNVHRVELPSLADFSVQWEMYESDRLDVMNVTCIPETHRYRAPRRYAGDYVSVPELATEFLGFDVSRPPFDDVRVRRAFVLATDRERLADEVSRGLLFPASGGFVPPGMPGHSPTIGLPYDPEEARRLLAEAGYPEGRGFPSVDAVVHIGRVGQFEYLRTQWRENLGVRITWEYADWVALFATLAERPPNIFAAGWVADYPDPDSFLRACHMVREHTRWRNEDYDGLVEQARRVTEHGERMKLYRQADGILVEEAAIMPLGYQRRHLLVKPWISKLPTSPIRHWFWKDVIIEPH